MNAIQSLLRKWYCGVLLGWVSTCQTEAANLGDPAPKIVVDEWFNGKPNPQDHETNVFVITFFESWCSSCMTALPQLNHCAEKFRNKGVRFLGISVEPTETVKAFAEEQSRLKVLNWPVGVDKEHATYDAYMKGFGRTSVPNSFVVDPKGKILWEGPPLAGLEQTLEQLVSHTFELSKAQKAEAARKLEDSYFNAAVGEADFKLLSGTTNTMSAREMGEKILTDGAANPWLLNSFAWRILTDPKLKNRDLDLAIRVSKAACELDPTHNPSFYDTHARAFYLQGKLSEAVAIQKHAVELASDPAQRSHLEKILVGYQDAARSSKP